MGVTFSITPALLTLAVAIFSTKFATASELSDYMKAIKAYAERPPSPSIANIASGFGASNGVGFAAVSYSDNDMQTDVEGDDDGSIVIGIGLGDPRENFGVEASIGITSVSTSLWGDGKFADEGNLNLKAHRLAPSFGLSDTASVSIGASNLAGWGSTTENPTNAFAAYSGIKYLGQFDEYSLGYTLGWGSAVSNTETDAGFFYGVALARANYNISIGYINSERHVSLSWQPQFVKNSSVTFTKVSDAENSQSARSIITLGYSLELFK